MKKSWTVLLLLGFTLPASAQTSVAPYREMTPSCSAPMAIRSVQHAHAGCRCLLLQGPGP